MLSDSQIYPAMNTGFLINSCNIGSVTRPSTSSIDAPSRGSLMQSSFADIAEVDAIADKKNAAVLINNTIVVE